MWPRSAPTATSRPRRPAASSTRPSTWGTHAAAVPSGLTPTTSNVAPTAAAPSAIPAWGGPPEATYRDAGREAEARGRGIGLRGGVRLRHAARDHDVRAARQGCPQGELQHAVLAAAEPQSCEVLALEPDVRAAEGRGEPRSRDERRGQH